MKLSYARPPEAAPETWRDLILTLPWQLQAPVASIVWWDKFGGRMSSERWPHLDLWVNQPHQEPAEEELIEALCAMGYGRRYARQRVERAQKCPAMRKQWRQRYHTHAAGALSVTRYAWP